MGPSSSSPVATSTTRMYRPIRWKVAPFAPQRSKWLDPLRARVVSIGIRFMLALGYVVFLIGRCRTGKTYLLKRTTPGKIIDCWDSWKQSGGALIFEPSAVPAGAFSIDELTGVDASSLRDWIETDGRKRAFVLAAQTMNDFEDRGLGGLLQSIGRKVLVMEISPDSH